MKNTSLHIVILKGKIYKNGTSPIMLQFTENGSVRRITVYKCKVDDWDDRARRLKTKAKNCPYINNLISEKFLEAERQLIRYKNNEISRFEFEDTKASLTLMEAFDLEVERLKQEIKVGSHDKVMALKVQFENLAQIRLSAIDTNWFDKVVSHQRNIGNIGSTIQKKIKMIRSIVQRYSEKEISADVKKFRVAITRTTKQKLVAHELEAIESLVIIEPEMAAVRDIFLMQIYLRGVRIGDLLQATASDFDNGRFVYKADKTQKDATVKLIPKAEAILKQYIGKNSYVFPFFTWKPDKRLNAFDNAHARLKHKEACTAIINRHLKTIAKFAGINKPISSHIARHTFARMAIDKINNPMITMDLLGHSSLAVHQAYLNDIRKDDVLDAATDDIFG